jgi:formate dehydrogenase subunit delta
MKIDTLVHMSNQIGDFFESMPDRDQAILDIATHLKRFWASPMRHQLLDCVERHTATDLKQIVKEAISKHADVLR